jgi:hypothetical protein
MRGSKYDACCNLLQLWPREVRAIQRLYGVWRFAKFR